MCVSAAVVMIGMTALSVGAQVYQGKEAAKAQRADARMLQQQAEIQAQQEEADAEAERGAARAYADKIRKAGREQASQIRASFASSGATGDAIDELVQSNNSAYEEDVLVAMYGGDGQARRRMAAAGSIRSNAAYQAASMRRGAKNTERNALLGAVGTAASGWYRVSGSKGAGAAPIEARTTPGRAGSSTGWGDARDTFGTYVG